jgi:septation ring formation regulator EzrA
MIGDITKRRSGKQSAALRALETARADVAAANAYLTELQRERYTLRDEVEQVGAQRHAALFDAGRARASTPDDAVAKLEQRLAAIGSETEANAVRTSGAERGLQDAEQALKQAMAAAYGELSGSLDQQAAEILSERRDLDERQQVVDERLASHRESWSILLDALGGEHERRNQPRDHAAGGSLLLDDNLSPTSRPSRPLRKATA